MTPCVDGLTRIGATVFQELRNAVFASVAQKAIRNVACSVYQHLLQLGFGFHLSRQTGGLTRAIDRGTKGISFLLTSMVFHVLPTALEISLVCGILVCCALRRDGKHVLMELDVPIWRQVCTHHGHHHGGLYRLHHPDHIVADQVPETG